MKTVAIYGRVSTAGQSPESQLQECRAYAERCGYEVVATYTDTIKVSPNAKPTIFNLDLMKFAGQIKGLLRKDDLVLEVRKN